jgi:hypothetical protein
LLPVCFCLVSDVVQKSSALAKRTVKEIKFKAVLAQRRLAARFDV